MKTKLFAGLMAGCLLAAAPLASADPRNSVLRVGPDGMMVRDEMEIIAAAVGAAVLIGCGVVETVMPAPVAIAGPSITGAAIAVCMLHRPVITGRVLETSSC